MAASAPKNDDEAIREAMVRFVNMEHIKREERTFLAIAVYPKGRFSFKDYLGYNHKFLIRATSRYEAFLVLADNLVQAHISKHGDPALPQLVPLSYKDVLGQDITEGHLSLRLERWVRFIDLDSSDEKILHPRNSGRTTKGAHPRE